MRPIFTSIMILFLITACGSATPAPLVTAQVTVTLTPAPTLTPTAAFTSTPELPPAIAEAQTNLGVDYQLKPAADGQ